MSHRPFSDQEKALIRELLPSEGVAGVLAEYARRGWPPREPKTIGMMASRMEITWRRSERRSGPPPYPPRPSRPPRSNAAVRPVAVAVGFQVALADVARGAVEAAREARGLLDQCEAVLSRLRIELAELEALAERAEGYAEGQK